jgi:hypothetical protein
MKRALDVIFSLLIVAISGSSYIVSCGGGGGGGTLSVHTLNLIMKGVRIAAYFFAISLMSGGPAFGNEIFHSGSNCLGCHTSPPQLREVDPSSTCLACHSSADKYYNIKSPNGSSFTAGGDYYWLGKTFQWTGAFNNHASSTGASHGHNIIALGYGLYVDARLKAAPGGTYPSDSLGCNSCHNPHAVTGSSYRLLGGVGYQAGLSSGFSFEKPAPIAVAPANWTENDNNHVSYGSGFSEWCANCHALILGCTVTHVDHHPACSSAFLGPDISAHYNHYISSGNLSGLSSVAYRALVPFENGTTDAASLNTSSTSGPGGDANVMCLSCHRAHASAFSSIGRWDFQAIILTDSHPSGAGDGSTYSDKLNSYYGRMFEDFQRQLCNKCHLKD